MNKKSKGIGNDPRVWYRVCNKLYFGNKLPKVPVKWAGRGFSVMARVGFDEEWKPTRIQLNPGLKKWPAAAAMCLLHEMAHIEVAQKGDHRTHHGKAWQKVMHRLARQKAFDGVW